MTENRKKIFNYLDYRVFLNDELYHRIKKNHNYSLRAYTRDLGVSVGFLSELLRGQKKLSLQKGKLLFTKFKLTSEELEYIYKLILYQKTESAIERANIFNEIWALYNKAGFIENTQKSIIEFNSTHFIVYGLIRKINKKSLIYKVGKKIGLDESKINSVILDLEKENYIYTDADCIFIYNEKLVFGNQQNPLSVILDFSNLLANSIMRKGGILPPERLAHAFTLVLDQDSYELAIETHKHYMKSLFKISSAGKKVDKILFISDFLLAVNIE